NKRALSSGLMVILAGVLAAVVILFTFDKIVVRPLHGLRDALSNVTEGDGDLTRRFHSKATNELGQIANGLDRLLDKVQQTILETRTSAQALLKSAKRLSHLADESSEAIEAQSAETMQVATAVHEMSVTAQNVAQHASGAQQATDQADNQAESGYTLVQD